MSCENEVNDVSGDEVEDMGEAYTYEKAYTEFRSNAQNSYQEAASALWYLNRALHYGVIGVVHPLRDPVNVLIYTLQELMGSEGFELDEDEGLGDYLAPEELAAGKALARQLLKAYGTYDWESMSKSCFKQS